MIGASYHRQATQLRCSGDLFDGIVVCSQGYVKYGTSADSIKIYCYLRASYHQYTIAMALASYFLLDIYVQPPWVSFVGQFGSAYSPQAYIRYAWKYRVLLPTYTNINLHTNYPTTYKTAFDDRHNFRCDIFAALDDWCMSVVWSLSIKMRDLVLCWYTDNNQPCKEEGEGGGDKDSTIYIPQN